MNTPNPLVPKGSLGEQAARGKSNLYILFFAVVTAHLLFFGGLLMSGCSKKTEAEGEPKEMASDTNLTNNPFPPLDSTNLPVETVINNNPPPLGVDPNQPGYPGGVVATNVPPPVVLTNNSTNTPTAVDIVNPNDPATGAGTTYQIQKNDSFYTVHKKLGIPLSAIQRANPGVDSTKLKIGQVINIPAYTPPAPGAGSVEVAGGASYTVKSGDSLSTIAKKHRTTVKAIRDANGLRTDTIKINQKLKIPAVTTGSPTATPPAQ